MHTINTKKTMPSGEKSRSFAWYYMNTRRVTVDMVWIVKDDFVDLEVRYTINLAHVLG